MKVTNAETQALKLQKKIEVFFVKSINNKQKKGFCITRDIMAVLLDKWSLLIVYNLGYFKKLRFNEIKKNVRGISPRMLSVTLKKLEKHNVINRHVFAEVPPRVEYQLTEFGLDLAEKSVDLNDWLLSRFADTKS